MRANCSSRSIRVDSACPIIEVVVSIGVVGCRLIVHVLVLVAQILLSILPVEHCLLLLVQLLQVLFHLQMRVEVHQLLSHHTYHFHFVQKQIIQLQHIILYIRARLIYFMQQHHFLKPN